MNEQAERARDALLKEFALSKAIRRSGQRDDPSEEYVVRRHRNFSAARKLAQAVGAPPGHPVAHRIIRDFGNAFALGSTGVAAWALASKRSEWLRSSEFDEQVRAWEHLATLPGEYAAELLG